MNRLACTTRSLLTLAGLLASALTMACSAGPAGGPLPPPPAATGDSRDAQAVLLVSIDGFRADYLDRGLTPNLARIAGEGGRADGLVPSFPTKTFPNHYTLVTGLVPDHHGIVANNMWDPELRATFGLSNRDAVGDGRWWGGEPIWVTAERAGLRTATLFWPGSEAEILGIRPTHWKPYDGDMPYGARIDWVLDRLAAPPPDGVRFATLYFSEIDDVGHRPGPDSPEMDAALRRIDAAIGDLLDGLAARDLDARVNVLVVSDHGMSPTSPERAILVDDYLDLDSVRVTDWNPVLALWPRPGDAGRVVRQLAGSHPHLRVWRKEDIPPGLQYGTHPRVAPVIALADPGWSITTRARWEEAPERLRGGNHGYDNEAPDMLGLFVARGPAFRQGLRVSAFSNVHIHALMARMLGLPGGDTDGDFEVVRPLLR